MGCTLYMLESTFASAYRTGANYVAVRVRFTGSDSGDEVIINPYENIMSKLEYYKTAYTERMELKANPSIKIINVAYGNSFREIENLI